MGEHQTAAIPSRSCTQSNCFMHCCSLLHEPIYAIMLHSAICQMFALLNGRGKGTGRTEHPVCVRRQAASVGHSQSLQLSSAALDVMRRQPMVPLEPGFPFGRHKALALHYTCSLCTSCSPYGSEQLAQSSWCASHWQERAGISVLHFRTAHFNLEMLLLFTIKLFPEKDDKLTKAKIRNSSKKMAFPEHKNFRETSLNSPQVIYQHSSFFHTSSSAKCNIFHLQLQTVQAFLNRPK